MCRTCGFTHEETTCPRWSADSPEASLANDVTGRLDRFVADLESQGMRVERDGFSVKIFVGGAS